MNQRGIDPTNSWNLILAKLKLSLLWLMAFAYVAAGANHFIDPDFYVRIMPPYLPWHLPLVWLSGVAEVCRRALP